MAAKIIQGGKSQIIVRLLTPTKDPYDLTLCTDIKCCFQNDDGTELMVSILSGAGIQVLNTTGGKIQITLTAAQTQLLRAIALGTLELAITFSSDPVNPIKVQIPDSYSVIQSQC